MTRHKAHHDTTLNMNWQSSIGVNTRVCIGKETIDKLPDLLAQMHVGKNVLLLKQSSICEKQIADLKDKLIKNDKTAHILELPNGEECKSVDCLNQVWGTLYNLHFSRQDTIVAIGGGTVTDLAGFAAATYLRGINFISVPTTLLAQVDAAIGGKTGINFDKGKNMLGTFYFAKAIIIDIDILQTLPHEQFVSGMAEVIKYGMLERTISAESDYRVGPKPLIDILMQEAGRLSWDNISLSGIIAACIKMKLSVVAHDPLEANLRRCLNLGHTLGHALEAAGNFNLSHGQAVSIGIAFAMHIAVSQSLFSEEDRQQILLLLQKTGLPIGIPANIQREELLNYLFRDKKSEAGGIKMVIPSGNLGQAEYKKLIARAEIEKMLASFR